MDLGGTTGAATTATPESTVVAENSCAATEKTEKEATSSGKNGSAPDSTVAKEKSSEAGQSVKVKDVPKESASPIKKLPETVAHKSVENNSKEAEVKSPAKQLVTTTTASVDATTPVKTPVAAGDAATSSAKEEGTDESTKQEDDMENDDLLLRLEALEKGEDPDMVRVEKKKEPETNHQNGMLEKAVEKPAPEAQAKQKETEKAEAGASDSVDMPPSSTNQVAVTTSPKKESNENNPATNKDEATPSKTAEAVSSNAKRKHTLNETESSNEPETKKVHISDVTDGPESSVVKAAAPAGCQSSPAKTQSEDAKSDTSSAGPPAPEPVRMDEAEEKPPSVEKMDVDGSPEPETSSSDNVDTLPDTEPNTEPEDKVEEISSSVAEEPTRSDSTEKAGKSDHSNVSSSDDKRSGTNDKAKPPDSEVSASVLPTPSEDEAMDVDEDVTDMAESSTSGGPTGGSVAAVPVVEPPCVKKVAYLCTDDEKAEVQKDVAKKPSTSHAKTSVASTSAAAPSTTTAASTSQAKVGKTEVESVSKASSSGVSPGKPVSKSAVVVDSSNKPSEKPSSASTSSSSSTNNTADVLDESVVESSQPSSSSDSKKQLSDNRLNEQLREAVHRSGLLAKASSTPNTSATLASSSPLTPKTLHPVTTSAVSSSNVYSSTPIHANFLKVSSGNVSKMTNPPSSIETSRVEADDTTTTTTTLATDQSTSVAATSEEKETASTVASASTASTTKSSLSVSPSKSETAGATVSSVKLSSPKKEMLKREESNSTSSSSLKTTDSSEVDSCTVASAMNTAEEINMYTTNARKFNGISSTSDGSELDIKSVVLKSHGSAKLEDESKVSLSSTVAQLDLSGAISPSTASDQQYEVSVWYEGKDLQFLSVERIHGKAGPSPFDPSATAGTSVVTQDLSSIDSASKQSSSTTTTNGSVSSLGPFSLSDTRAGASAAAAQSSDSSLGSVVVTAPGGATEQHSLAKSSTSTMTKPQLKHTVMGSTALCDLLIDEFKKLRRTFAPDVVDELEARQDEADGQLLQTPKTSGSARGQRGGSGSTKKSAVSRGQKRPKAFDSEEDDDDAGEQRTPRVGGSSASKQAAKKAKAVGSSESPVVTSTATPKPKATPEPKQFDICCLARWTDRKYYAGRVTNFRGDNKYVVVFEDGCSKTLSRDIIVFGDDGILPILNHSIHALTGGDTYEPAIVEEIKRNEENNEVVYAVRTASSALEVTATDIYLSDEQAKWIHNACKDKPDPMQQLRQSAASGAGSASADGTDHAGGGDGPAREGSRGGSVAASEHATEAGADKSARSTRSKRGAGDKSMTPATPEAGYSGGVGKKGRRGRRKALPAPEPNISECSDVSDTYEEEVRTPISPEAAGLDAVDGVQPELQRTEQESELASMMLVSEYFGNNASRKQECLDDLLGPIPVGAKTLFRNKHFLLSCTIPLKVSPCNGESSKYKTFSNVPFVKQHVRRQIEAGGGKVYQFFEDVPKNKYKLCKLIAPRPSTTASYVQCMACDIPAVSHEWIIQCCQVLLLVDHKPYTLPCGWSFLENRYMEWGCGRSKDKRNSSTPFSSISINVASLCKDFNDFWSRVCKLAGATVRLIKTESDVTENLTGYLLTDQEFPEEIKIKAARNGLLVVSTVWVVQCLIVGRVCHPKSHEKLTQIYQEDDY